MMVKICVFGCNHWIADVETVQDYWHFEVPKNSDREVISQIAFSGNWKDAGTAGNPTPGSVQVHQVDFQGLENGLILRISRRVGEECIYQDWLVPKGSVYLMEQGRTVDRI